MAEIKNDMGPIYMALGILGYTGDLDAAMPRQKREIISGAGNWLGPSWAICGAQKSRYDAET